ncbi:hypothetical protein ABT168_08880 [Streptomyces sp. NPDC001793]|uniref:hypothetical protein n=1 Tax=Streptomyces sp. NPDC001793 TaxID=3154657 RepID=UPI00331C7683
MIRIVTRAHLAMLEQAIESAQARIKEVQGAADEAASCHTRSVQRLSTALATARAAANRHQADAETCREFLGLTKDQLAEAQATVAEQAEQIKTLQADLDAVSGTVVLLRFGRLDSVHPTDAAAQAHARSLGCPDSKWGPASSKPATEVPWRTAPLSNFVVPDGGGAG